MAYQDSLTDLYNHRYFYEQLSHEVERAQRYGRPVSVILLDLDNFKQVNDTYGHLMGDKLLALMGQVIKDQVRSADIAARYGGDESNCATIEPPCALITGACHDDTTGACRDDTARVDCEGRGFRYGGDFSYCPTVIAIPAASGWGLVVLTLLLLSGTKVYTRHWRTRVSG
ncbi:MAG: GGDEF domain-containing protein [Planctomycetes bacterium]|nr:GGDEF domain-containing protein [Planctomycetota bacterium]